MSRKKYSKELKSRIAIDAIKGQKTRREIEGNWGRREIGDIHK